MSFKTGDKVVCKVLAGAGGPYIMDSIEAHPWVRDIVVKIIGQFDNRDMFTVLVTDEYLSSWPIDASRIQGTDMDEKYIGQDGWNVYGKAMRPLKRNSRCKRCG